MMDGQTDGPWDLPVLPDIDFSPHFLSVAHGRWQSPRKKTQFLSTAGEPAPRPHPRLSSTAAGGWPGAAWPLSPLLSVEKMSRADGAHRPSEKSSLAPHPFA